MSECNQACSSCSENCSERKEELDLKEKLHPMSNVKKVIGVVSGKGGVGKSLVTSLLASGMNKKGYKTAVLDADITGPSIPKAFGITSKAVGNENGMMPVKSKNGTDVMSINLLLNDITDPVVWRGPIVGNTVKQFWNEVIWKDIDYMFIDMPPGTGDVPLTVFQSIPIEGIVIVTSPQELVSMIVEKAVKMADKMNIPIIGIVENMSGFKCPECNQVHNIFGDSNIEKVAQEYGIKVLDRLPIDPAIARACDAGEIESYSGNIMENTLKIIEETRI